MKNQYKPIYAPFEQSQNDGNTQLVGWAEQSDAQITELFFGDSKVVGVRRLTPTYGFNFLFSRFNPTTAYSTHTPYFGRRLRGFESKHAFTAEYAVIKRVIPRKRKY